MIQKLIIEFKFEGTPSQDCSSPAGPGGGRLGLPAGGGESESRAFDELEGTVPVTATSRALAGGGA